MEERKRIGFGVMVFLILLAGVLYRRLPQSLAATRTERRLLAPEFVARAHVRQVRSARASAQEPKILALSASQSPQVTGGFFYWGQSLGCLQLVDSTGPSPISTITPGSSLAPSKCALPGKCVTKVPARIGQVLAGS